MSGTTTISFGPPYVTPFDAATITGPVVVSGGTAEVTTSLTGGDPSASFTVSQGAWLHFVGDVTVASLPVQATYASTDGTLTLGSDVSLTLPAVAAPGAIGLTGTLANSALVNDGTILIPDSGTADMVQKIVLPRFTNAGTLAIGTNDVLAVVSDAFTNSGGITIAGGSVLQLTLSSSLADLPARLGNIGGAGSLVLHLSGTIDNTGSLFDAGVANVAGVSSLGARVTVPGTSLLLASAAAELDGGTLDLASGSLELANATLSGVAVEGDLVLDGSDSVSLTNGTTLRGTGGTGAGHIVLAGTDVMLSLGTGEVLNDVTITVAHSTSGYVQLSGADAFTLGANALLEVQTNTAPSTLAIGAPNGVVNHGTIRLADNAGRLELAEWTYNDQATLASDGLVALGTGDTLWVDGIGTGSGTITLAGNDQLTFTGAVTGGTIVLAGVGNSVTLGDLAGSSLTLSGLVVGDTLDLGHVTVTSVQTLGGALVFYNDTTELGSIVTPDDFSTASFVLTSANAGLDTLVSLLGAAPFAGYAGYTSPPDSTLVINGGSIDNTGGIRAGERGNIEFTGAVGDAGTVEGAGVAMGSTLTLDQLAGFTAVTNSSFYRTVLPAGTGYSLSVTPGTLDVLQNGTLAASFGISSFDDRANFVLDTSGARPVIIESSTGVVLPGPADQMFLIDDQTTHLSSGDHGETYSGPVAGLTGQFIDVTTSNINVATGNAGVFIRTGSGDDAVQVTSGDNVIDASTGSNFLTGGSGHDTFFVDARDANPIWDSIVNFHQGDALTVWGYSPGISTYNWADGLGAPGYTGLTLQIQPTATATAAQATLVGLTSADQASLVVQTGTVDGNSYLSIIHV